MEGLILAVIFAVAGTVGEIMKQAKKKQKTLAGLPGSEKRGEEVLHRRPVFESVTEPEAERSEPVSSDEADLPQDKKYVTARRDLTPVSDPIMPLSASDSEMLSEDSFSEIAPEFSLRDAIIAQTILERKY